MRKETDGAAELCSTRRITRNVHECDVENINSEFRRCRGVMPREFNDRLSQSRGIIFVIAQVRVRRKHAIQRFSASP
jgi:hypothetical protein